MRETVVWIGALLVALAGPSAAQQAMAPEVTIANAPESEWHPAVAYNDQRDEYLVVWGENGTDIWARRLDRCGRPVGAAFLVVVTGNPRYDPAVAYDGVNDRYLVVWVYEYVPGGADRDIYGRFVSGEGVPLSGGSFPIEGTTHQEAFPAVAFARWSEKFLVTWNEWTAATNGTVRGALVSFESGPGASFEIASHASQYRQYSALAWDPWSDKFLVAYDNNADIFGRLVTPAGAVGSEIPIAAWPAAERRAAVATCDNYQFLVIWESEVAADDEDLFGRAMLGDGSFWGDVLHLASADWNENNASVACRYGGTEYLVTWRAGYGTGGGDLVGTRVSSTLAVAGGFVVRLGAVYSNAAAGGATGWLVAWEEDADIRGRAVWDLFVDGFEWGSTANWSSTSP